MKIFRFENGWTFCPSAWRSYLLKPIKIERYPGWMVIEVLGFAVFIERHGDAAP